MTRSVAAIGVGMSMVLGLAAPSTAQRQMEKLTRGVVAVKLDNGRVYVGWRLFGTDPEAMAFNLYRTTEGSAPVKVNDESIAGATNYVDSDADVSKSLEYFVRPVSGDGELAASKAVRAWESEYIEIPISVIDDYRPGDASLADLDGDGEYEIVLHQTKNGRDNSFAGVTGTPVFDAYELDGTHMWRIDLGINIREGEHYTQFMVYDLDGDGRAEMACKTADGTIDGNGKVIGDKDKDWRTRVDGGRRDGRILDGPEYFTIFDGQSGAALETVDYVPSRDPVHGWGGIGGNGRNDSFGNRCDRFLACVAYLDGERPSVVMCRGVYGRIVMAAWDWRSGKLTSRWVFDSGNSYPPYDDASPFSGMGGHSLSVADVDNDGKDEICYQAMVVDDDGEGLYSTGLRHGDAMHISDMYPDRPGQEIFTVQENENETVAFMTPGAAMRDARTGEILWCHSPGVDVGAGVAADIDPRHRGYEAWGGPGGLRDRQGQVIGPSPRSTDFVIWWDGDLLRELITRPRFRGRRGNRRGTSRASTQERRDAGNNGDPTPEQLARFRAMRRRPTVRVSKWNWESGEEEEIWDSGSLGGGRGPNLMADILGDWREELLLTSPDGRALRLYTTTIPTEHRLYTLMHNPQYRLGITWQNVVYNKPAHPDFYLGDGMDSPGRPEIRVVGAGEALVGSSP